MSKQPAFKMGNAPQQPVSQDDWMCLQRTRVDGESAATDMQTLRALGIELVEISSLAVASKRLQELLDEIGERTIEGLVELPSMSHHDFLAAMRIGSALLAPPLHIKPDLFLPLAFEMTSASLRHGICDASIHSFSVMAQILGPIFGRYEDGYRFAKLAMACVARHAFRRTKAYFSMENACVWVQPASTAVHYARKAIQSASEEGDLAYGVLSSCHLIADLMLQEVPLDHLLREIAECRRLIEAAGFTDALGLVSSFERYALMLTGRTDRLGSFGGSDLHGAAFEATPGNIGLPRLISGYWILRLQAHYEAGEFELALVAADEAQEKSGSFETLIQSAYFHWYRSLAISMLFANISVEIPAHRQEQMRDAEARFANLAQMCPETFLARYELLLAERSKLAGLHESASAAYERAIEAARTAGLSASEAIANECAAAFHLNLEHLACSEIYLSAAAACYQRWGASAKARRLLSRISQPVNQPVVLSTTSTIHAAGDQLDLLTVGRSILAISGEIELDRLVRTLMTIALERGGGDRSGLLNYRGGSWLLQAQASTQAQETDVRFFDDPSPVSPMAFPLGLLNITARDRLVIIDNHARQNPALADDIYLRHLGPESVICVPLVRQEELVGAIYMEHRFVSGAFTQRGVEFLEILAAQAVISLENARLYDELRRENAERRNAQSALRMNAAFMGITEKVSRTGSWSWRPRESRMTWSAELYRLLELDPAADAPSWETFQGCVVPEDRDRVVSTMAEAIQSAQDFRCEYKIFAKSGRQKFLVAHAAPDHGCTDGPSFVGTVMDVTTEREAELAVRAARSELARVSRLSSIGELASSIVSQLDGPLAAVRDNIDSALIHLVASPPAIASAHAVIVTVVQDGNRAAEAVRCVRRLFSSSPLVPQCLDLAETVEAVVTLLRDDIVRQEATVQIESNVRRQFVTADRTQIQQVLVHMVTNALEAMATNRDRTRSLSIRISNSNRRVTVTIADNGRGLPQLEGAFDPFRSTKPDRMGLGLTTCRSIVEAHGGRVCVTPNYPYGTVFGFSLPIADGGTVQ